MTDSVHVFGDFVYYIRIFGCQWKFGWLRFATYSYRNRILYGESILSSCSTTETCFFNSYEHTKLVVTDCKNNFNSRDGVFWAECTTKAYDSSSTNRCVFDIELLTQTIGPQSRRDRDATSTSGEIYKDQSMYFTEWHNAPPKDLGRAFTRGGLHQSLIPAVITIPGIRLRHCTHMPG